MRRPLIAGNWKMNLTASGAEPLLSALTGAGKGKGEVLVCPPFTDIPAAAELLRDTAVSWGAQNMYPEENGAFTGEISPLMLKELGCSYVICGHSERRLLFGETDDLVRKKTETAFRYGMLPILCVGESASQRKEGRTASWISGQVRAAVKDLSSEQISRMVIAYEPIWAIGTGAAATAEDAQEVCAVIRYTAETSADRKAAENLRILYGGSVNSSNIASFLCEKDIDGALIGGASLKAEEFLSICTQADR